MLRKHLSGLIAATGILAFSAAHGQPFFSPSQTDLLNFAFADYWPGNGAALTSVTPVGADGVEFTFDTGFSSPTPDAFSRSQWTLPFTQDLTGYTNIGLAFQVPSGGSVNGHPLFAQIGLHYNGGNSSAVSGWTAINSTSRTNIYMPLSVIPPAQLSQLTSFDIELRSEDPFEVDMGDRVRAFTAPPPPEYVDGYQINDFEGNDIGTWGPAFQPDHSHMIVAADGSDYNNGVTKGTHALQIVRTYTGSGLEGEPSNTSFRWGSQMQLNATGGGAPVGDYNNNGTVDAADYTLYRNNFGTSFALQNRDPANTGNVSQADYDSWKANFGMTGSGNDPVQQNINEVVDALNAAADSGGRLAFDVSFTNPDQFPDANPGFLGFEMFITDGSGGFFQPDTTLIGQTSGQGFGFPPVPAVDSFYKGVTLSLPLNIFRDQSSNAFGLLGARDLQKTNTFTLGLASNTDGNATFSIDNIRILNLVTSGLGAGAAVPEPNSLLVVLLASATLAVAGRRRA